MSQEPLAREAEVAAFRDAVLTKLTYAVGKDPDHAFDHDWFEAIALAARDHMVEHWMDHTRRIYRSGQKRVYYLSLEFLIGRLLFDSLSNLGLWEVAREAVGELGVDLERIRLLEQDLQVKLLHRTTRRVAVTEEGERVFHWAQRILDDMEQLMQEVAITRSEPRGLLRVSSSFGFGRQIVAPALSRLVEQHPGLQVRLEVFDRLVDVAGEGFDLDVRVGDEIAPHLIARRLADNHRVLCAAPAYLARRG
eukprot:gene40677-50329_t